MLCSLLVLLQINTAALADENLIFSVSDFINPKELNYEFGSNNPAQLSLLAIAPAFGYIQDLEYQDENSTVDTVFKAVSADFYSGRYQVGLQVSDFNSSRFSTNNIIKELQLSFYTKLRDDSSSIARYSMYISDGNDLNGIDFNDIRLTSEVSLQEKDDGGYGHPYGGAFEFRYRKVRGADDIKSFKYRFNRTFYLSYRHQFDAGISVGVEKDQNSFDLAITKLTFNYSYRTRWEFDVMFRWHPTYDHQPGLESHKFGHQLSFFVITPFLNMFER